MLNDRHLKKLNEAWASMNAPTGNVAPTNEAGPISQIPALTEELKSLLTVKDNEVDVEVNLGWQGIARIDEDDNVWFPSVLGHQISTMGLKTKEEALKAIIAYLKND